MVQHRSLLRADVVRARRTERVRGSSPSDFVLGRSTAAPRESLSDPHAIPYCLDLVRRRSIYVEHVDRRALQAAPFSYLYLRRTARSVLTVPWGANARDGEERMPVLVFSPGRAGSTLLSSIFVEARVPTISEPDFYTQATEPFAASPLNPMRDAIAREVHDLERALVRSLAPDSALIVKLRADCNRAPNAFMQPGEARTIFLARKFEDWAPSMLRYFRGGARVAVARYLVALECYAWLAKNSDCHLLRYEDLTAQPAAMAARLGGFLALDLPNDAIGRAMNKDSQEGTPLAQGSRPPNEDWQAEFAKALAIWNSDRLKRLRARLPAEAGA